MQDQVIDIEKLRVKPTDAVTRDQVVLYFKADYGWTEVMTAGNISTVIGKAKSRKTFFTTLLIVGAINNRLQQFRSQLTGDVVLFDTEQGKFHVWKITKRIENMMGDFPDSIRVYGLRPLTVAERIDTIEKYLYLKEPQLVFIDGVRDLVTDINSAEQATEIVGKLMRWSYDLHCHICCVLHQNKADDNARGHIGTEIVNKSESVLSVSKTKDKSYSLVKSEYTRGMETKEFKFTIDNNIPVIDETEMAGSFDNDNTKPF